MYTYVALFAAGLVVITAAAVAASRIYEVLRILETERNPIPTLCLRVAIFIVFYGVALYRSPSVCRRYDKKMPKKTQDQTQYQASLHKVTD